MKKHGQGNERKIYEVNSHTQKQDQLILDVACISEEELEQMKGPKMNGNTAFRLTM